VLLKTASQIEQGLQKAQDEPIRLATSYYLVYNDLIRLFYNKTKPALDQVLERGIQHQFDISPIATKNPEEHIQLAKYLISSILTIDIWNAADQTHFASCKVPLAGILR